MQSRRRFTVLRDFSHTRVDFPDPASLRPWKVRGHKSVKAWLAIFVCMATSTVYLEVVSDYSSDAFIAAFRRFVSRPEFVGTYTATVGRTFRVLRNNSSNFSAQARNFTLLLLGDGTQWSFNPPGAP